MTASRPAAIRVLAAASVAGGLLAASASAPALAQDAAQPARGAVAVPQPMLERQFPLGVTYEAVSVSGRSVEGDRPAMTLDQTFRLHGFAGCNTYSAIAYPLQNQGLAVGPFALTRKQCDQATMQRERAFLEALRAAREWDINGGELVIRGGRGELRLRQAL